jgi:hypothetical protein
MQNNQQLSNNTTDNNSEEYKMCARLGCSSIGRNRLKIIYIKKSGWFCDNCTIEIVKSVLNLAEN